MIYFVVFFSENLSKFQTVSEPEVTLLRTKILSLFTWSCARHTKYARNDKNAIIFRPTYNTQSMLGWLEINTILWIRRTSRRQEPCEMGASAGTDISIKNIAFSLHAMQPNGNIHYLLKRKSFANISKRSWNYQFLEKVSNETEVVEILI